MASQESISMPRSSKSKTSTSCTTKPAELSGTIYPKEPLAVERLSRRRELIHYDTYSHQLGLGRPPTNRGWCGKPTCYEERAIYGQPFAILRLQYWSKDGHSVADYMKDFAHAMVDGLFPNLTDGPAKIVKCQALEWFINSPPVMMAYWYFHEGAIMSDLTTTDATVLEAAHEARPRFLEFLQQPRSEESIDMIHKYTKSKNPQPNDEWTLEDYALRFMLCIETWRHRGARRWKDWSFGTPEHTADLLIALLYNFCIMKHDRCFYLFIDMNEQWWDGNWETWLVQNPTILAQEYQDESFVTRNNIEGTEEDALERVGYLGGVGSYTPVWTQRPKRR